MWRKRSGVTCEEEWGDICEEEVDVNSEIEGTDVQD